MADVFLKIVNMSISASWLVLAVLVFRLVFKKAPKWIHVLLWGIVAVRLLCPFSIESALSLIPSAETISPEIMMSPEPTIHTGVPAINSVVNPIITETFAPEPVASANPLQIWIPVLAIIWGIGVALLLAYTAISYWRLHRKVRIAVLLRDNIFQSEVVSSPFVLGIIKPKIYLPFQMDGQNLEHVVSHEQAHIRRRDHWWKPLGFLLLTIHWFNPLMWLAYVLLCHDIELACDEKVVKVLGMEQRADYSQALLACSVNRRMIAACPLAFGEVGVKERVKSVLNYKKPAFWVIVVALIAGAVVAVCFLTNPMGFRFDEAAHTIVSANHFDMRNADDAVAVEMNPAQISELSSRLAGVKSTKKSAEYGGLTPCYQISALLELGTYIRISGYSFSANDMVDIEWNGERYVVSDGEFHNYLSRICAGDDVSAANTSPERIAGYSALYSEELINEAFRVAEKEFNQRFDHCTLTELRYDAEIENQYADTIMNWGESGQELITVVSAFEAREGSSGACVWYLVRTEDKKSWEYATWEHLGKSISLNDVIILSQKGYDLTWSDFDQYKYIETGSGLYIRLYEINESFGLSIGGVPNKKPMYIYLSVNADDTNAHIDIRDGGVTEFISQYGNNQDLTSTFNEEELLEIFKKSNDEDGTVMTTDCVIATDGAYGLDGVVQYADETGAPWKLAFIRDGVAYPVSLEYGTEYVIASDLTYLGNGVVQAYIENLNDGTVDVCKMAYSYDEAENITNFKATEEEYSRLTDEELVKFNETFNPIVYDKQGNSIGVNPLSGFFSSYYDDVRNLDFEEFMRYFPEDGSFASDAEFEALKTVEAWPFDWVETRDDMPVPIHKYQARIVDMVLKEHAGITTADLDTSAVAYLANYDAFYNYTSDFGPGMFTCTRGEVVGDIVRLYEELETGTDMLTLRKVGNSYQIVAHQCIEGDNGTERYYG